MIQKPSLPNPEKVQQTVTKMREVCRQFDRLNFALDELKLLLLAHALAIFPHLASIYR